MNPEHNPPSPPRSTFVTVVAWIFIVLSGFMTLITLMQNIMIHTVFVDQGFDPAALAANVPEGQPFLASFMFANFLWFFGFIFVVALTLLCSSIGLLLRKNWARLVFIGVMALAIAWNVFGLVLHFTMLGSFTDMPPGTPADVQDQMQTMAVVMGIFSAVLGLGFIALHGWLIKRLVSAQVRREFGALA